MISELVQEARAGHEIAWNTLYRKFYPGLYSIALRMYGDIPSARDAVQETFVIAYLKLPQLKEEATFAGWLKKILIHYIYRDLKRKQKSTSLDALPPKNDGWWEDELNSKLDLLSTQSRLYSALAHLPEVLQSTMLLRYFSAFHAYEQIASILGVPVGTIRSRLNQAKLKLTTQWHSQPEVSMHIFQESELWNEFYSTTYSGLHQHEDYKNEFINHLQKDVQIILSGQEMLAGNCFFDRKVSEDKQVGSWLKTSNVTSCGDISILEADHFNSPEHPFHCPSQSVAVLYRNKNKVSKMYLYTSPQ
ncbi:sigma-70 family RNA polymerase sigma factor [Rhodocytophaga rosea]|uniref:Sigma-70 family RNA polymerase sigma factor n=1 Tax=Rhodocytophaga rosea TaxID=2704465 RepID=A0A6C0GMD8_9BACT|nr:sigma-70 family RNA polymerase sigma factor [Rhodocytophaga rosea]QHT68772.1 sigma-70 family RNA polymerase sigma factor [Rhodocytophaga rosea]